jgi:hypothetical protein
MGWLFLVPTILLLLANGVEYLLGVSDPAGHLILLGIEHIGKRLISRLTFFGREHDSFLFSLEQDLTVVKEVHLRLARLARVHRSNCSVLLVQPRPLHISLLLGVVLFAVNFSNKVRNNLGSLILHRADTSTSI